MKPIVKFTNVSKQYSLYKKKSDQLFEIFSFKKNSKSFNALSDVSFEVFPGETIGIIGTNGSGKSTLSNLLAQVVPPSTGDIEIRGEPTLVAISAGLNNHLTGYENIELKCLMHGMSKKEIEAITPEIIEFADIGDFIAQPIKNYSSGMKSRLGFAISVHIDPDILVIDEALSVGDSTFHQKCEEKFNEFKQRGKTIFFISHSLSQVKSISDRIMWMNYGRIEMFDETEKVGKEYSSFIKWFNNLTKKEKKEYKQSMLHTQMDHKTIETDPIKRVEKKRKKKKPFLSFVQVAALMLCVVFSTMLMFFDHPIKALQGSFDSIGAKELTSEIIEDDQKSKDDKPEVLKVDQKGYIVADGAPFFADQNMTTEKNVLPFTTEVQVDEKVGDVYHITYKNEEGYVKGNDVSIGSREDKAADISLEELSTTFPETFAQSYEYFFAFENADYDEVKSTFKGLSEEGEDERGRPFLLYDAEHMAFKFNEENQAEEIEVRDVDVNEDPVQKMMDSSLLTSNDETLYYIENSSYKIYLDVEQEKLRFVSK